MKTKKTFTKQEFTHYKEMNKSAKNWTHFCTYQLLPHALQGEHHVIELPSLQLSYSNRKGGFMHNAMSPKGMISIAVIQECKGKACFDRMKLHKGDILFFDDSKAFNFMSNDHIKVAIVSLSIELEIIEKLGLSSLLGYFMRDENMYFSNLLTTILEEVNSVEGIARLEHYQERIFTTLKHIIKKQNLQKTKLTEGEKVALIIRDQIYHHMDAKISIASLSEEHQVSQQTLQNSFRSLFGFTPKLFLRLLKLNLVHHDLRNAHSKEASVSKIALKWGFMHMGRFSGYYTALFGENPSVTLKTYYPLEDTISSDCTMRQEEMA